MDERMVAMNIAGVTQTAQVLPQTQTQNQVPEPVQPQEAQNLSGDVVNMSAQVSTQVLDMAQSQFEDAAQQLISTMAAATGIGQNVDMTV